MTFKTLALAGVALAMISGAAVAQTTNSATGAQGSTPPGAILDDNTKMQPFYTDSEMKTMRTGDEFKSAWMGMSAEDRDRVKNECQNTNSPKASFCESVKMMQ